MHYYPQYVCGNKQERLCNLPKITQVRLMGFGDLDGEYCPPSALPLTGAGQLSSLPHPCQRLWRLPTLSKSGGEVMGNLVGTPHQRDKKSHSPYLPLPARRGQEWDPGRIV